MAYKLIALDLDETLLDKQTQIPPRVNQAIQDARAKGAYVVLCTGRTRKGALRFYQELGLDTLFILSGGAEVCDAAGQLVFSRPVDPDMTAKLLQYAYDNSIHAQVFIDGELCFRERNKYALAYEASFGYPGIVMDDLLDKHIITPKVLYITDEDRIDRIQEETERLFPSLSVMRSRPIYLEYTCAHISKGEALKFVAEYYNVDRSQTIAVGDSQIDISMIEYAGLGVAMANAAPNIQRIADIVCASNEEGGVADVINQYILEAV